MQLEKIINEYGTPSYVFDIDSLNKRIKYLKEKLADYEIVYAIKANPFIIKDASLLVDRFEICSSGEYEICDKLMIDSQKMVISGVYKDEKIISEMLQKKDILRYTIESLNQYYMLAKLAQKYSKKIHLLIRLTSGNQFGINEEEVKKIIKEHDSNYLIIEGIEYFSGTQKHSLKIINKEITYLKNFIKAIEQELNFKINELEYGPGLPVYYFKDEEFDEDNYLNELKKLLDSIDLKVTIEIGRSIVASCGYYITKIVDMKTNKYGNYLILDGGINQLVYYGQTMAMRIPYLDIYPKNNKEEICYNLCGSLCTTNDILVKNISLHKVNINDVIIFKNTGAYSVTEGISLFLSHELPKVILHYSNKDILVRNNFKTSELNFPNIEE